MAGADRRALPCDGTPHRTYVPLKGKTIRGVEDGGPILRITNRIARRVPEVGLGN